jgi:ABC-type glycerol-3-phosphate transport system substrate-binding protein
MKAAAFASLGAVALVLAACGGSSRTPATRASASSVPQLRSIEQLRAAFNAHASMPRLVVLISPT